MSADDSLLVLTIEIIGKCLLSKGVCQKSELLKQLEHTQGKLQVSRWLKYL